MDKYLPYRNYGTNFSKAKMKKFLIADLARVIKGDVEYNSVHGSRVTSHFLKGVSTDSRTTKAGDCFFAIAGNSIVLLHD